jgi:hypothetical membrane protein
MEPERRVEPFVARHPLMGPLAWLVSVQFFVVQVVVASAWTEPAYSWRLDAISDLGARGCGQFDDRYVCSPLHGLMNVSLVVLGLCMAIGAVLLHRASGRSAAGFFMMGMSGLGAVVVGIFPEDSVFWVHITGQDLAFLSGNTALIVIGLSLPLPRWFRWYSTLSGVVALVGLCLFLSHHRYALELGGMERVVAYPLTIWLIVCGLHLARSPHRSAPEPVGAPGL